MTSGRSLVLAFVIAAAAFVITHLLPVPGSVHELMAATGGQPIFDMQPSFSPEETYARVAAFGETGRAMYTRTLVTTDVIFPLCVLVFLFLLGRYTVARLTPPPPIRLLLIGLPIAYFAADLIENASIFALLAAYPERNELIAACLPYITITKRIAQAAALLLPAALWAGHAIIRLKTNASSR